MQQGKPLGLSKNARLCICPARHERTFGGNPPFVTFDVTPKSWTDY